MRIRFATREDVPVILEFIHGLAAYEHLENEVVATPEILEEWLFDKQKAEVIFALPDAPEGAGATGADAAGVADAPEGAGAAEATEEPVGFALFFHNFSTFLGRAGIYLEDLFVKPEFRGQGYGKGLISALARIALERGCGRLEWACLDWNQPSIEFYTKIMSATPMDEWTVYRLTGDTLRAAAENAE